MRSQGQSGTSRSPTRLPGSTRPLPVLLRPRAPPRSRQTSNQRIEERSQGPEDLPEETRVGVRSAPGCLKALGFAAVARIATAAKRSQSLRSRRLRSMQEASASGYESDWKWTSIGFATLRIPRSSTPVFALASRVLAGSGMIRSTVSRGLRCVRRYEPPVAERTRQRDLANDGSAGAHRPVRRLEVTIFRGFENPVRGWHVTPGRSCVGSLPRESTSQGLPLVAAGRDADRREKRGYVISSSHALTSAGVRSTFRRSMIVASSSSGTRPAR